MALQAYFKVMSLPGRLLRWPLLLLFVLLGQSFLQYLPADVIILFVQFGIGLLRGAVQNLIVIFIATGISQSLRQPNIVITHGG